MWILLLIVVIVFVAREMREGFGFDKSQIYVSELNDFKVDSLKTTPDVYPRESIDVLADATFKPECCFHPYSNPYSSSSGCLCPSSNDAGIIITRGGNR